MKIDYVNAHQCEDDSPHLTMRYLNRFVVTNIIRNINVVTVEHNLMCDKIILDMGAWESVMDYEGFKSIVTNSSHDKHNNISLSFMAGYFIISFISVRVLVVSFGLKAGQPMGTRVKRKPQIRKKKR